MPSALIVEDEKNIVEVINRFLTAKGITVYATENGVEAVSLAKSKKPDMILLDINIQGISGIDALRQIREFNPQQKIMVITGLVEDDVEDKVRALGAWAFLRKPIKLSAVGALFNEAGVV